MPVAPFQPITLAQRRLVNAFNVLLLGRVLAGPCLVALALGLALRALGAGTWGAWAFVALAGPLYLAWLAALVLVWALESALLGRVFAKPRRYRFKEGSPTTRDTKAFLATLVLYAKAKVMRSLPCGDPALVGGTGYLGRLWYRTYSFGCAVDLRAFIYGEVCDPDLTTVGPFAVVGDGCRVVAHSFVMEPDGSLVFTTAPVFIGPCVTVGGGTQIELGAVIGEGALIEPESHVPPFARIPAGEVWGGRPAVFRRRRAGTAATAAAPAAAPSAPPAEGDVADLVAHALALPVGTLAVDASSATCPAWDSLGKLAIAAALHDRFGLALPAAQALGLDSLDHVRHALARATDAPAAASRDPELLPLDDPAAATASLARSPSAPAHRGRCRVVVAASFVAEPLAPTLRLWCRAFGIEAEVSFAGFGQVAQALLAPDGPFAANRDGLNVVLLRPEDLPAAPDEAKRSVDDLLRAVAAHAAGAAHPPLVGDLPPAVSPAGPSAELVDELRARWRAGLSAVPTLAFADLVQALGLERSAGEPYAPAVFQRLGRAVARSVRRLLLPSKKVLVADADGTLWDGVVGEDGPAGLTLDGGFRSVQERLRALRERGVLLALATRNEASDIEAAFAAHADWPLRRADLAAVRAGWGPKSVALREVAAELGLGSDSFVFLDDNPVERAEVEAHAPEVTVVPLPPTPASFAATLDRLWCFDAAASTAEDAARAAMVDHEAARRQDRAGALDLASWLRDLGLEVEVRRAEAADLDRVAQLTQKTNQFNLSLRRRTKAELEPLVAAGEVLVARARDRFGDYGLVGVAILRDGDETVAVLDTFLLSCRVLGRGVEDAFLHAVCAAAGGRPLVAPWAAGPRNAPAREFLARLGAVPASAEALRLEPAASPPVPTHVRLSGLAELYRTAAVG